MEVGAARRAPRLAAALLLLALAPAGLAAQDYVRPGEAGPLPPALQETVSGLQVARVASHIAFLAAPSLEGRGLGGNGLEAAADYVAAQLALAGVAPPGPAAGRNPLEPYFQPVALKEISRPGGTLTLARGTGEAALRRVFRPGAQALFPEIPPGVVQGAAVFAGYGIREAAPARDDYGGLDVKGKVVVLLGGLPPGPEWRTKELERRYDGEGSWRFAAKLALAGSLGARAVVAIEGGDFAAERAKEAAAPAPTFFVLAEPDSPPLPPVVRVTPRVGDQILRVASLTAASARSARPRPLPGVSLRLETTGRERPVSARNVLAVIPGADPARRGEAVVIGA
ncbi:MAG: peptidase, partial [Acidobacteria bacterium]|nr:peptidase [Acidobacteriota bacterium]